LGGNRACLSGKAGFPFVVASSRLFFCKQCVAFLAPPLKLRRTRTSGSDCPASA